MEPPPKPPRPKNHQPDQAKYLQLRHKHIFPKYCYLYYGSSYQYQGLIGQAHCNRQFPLEGTYYLEVALLISLA